MLRIKRQNMFVDMMRQYEVYIDGVLQGTVSNGETESFDITPGHHLIQIKIDWCTSKKISIDIESGESPTLHTGSSMRWFVFPFLYLFKLSLFKSNYVKLQEERLMTQALEIKYNPKLAEKYNKFSMSVEF